MLPDSAPHKLIQSYVVERFFVSTAFRRASTPEDIWYYETGVWQWLPDERRRGEMYAMVGGPRYPEGALRQHARICMRLAELSHNSSRDAIVATLDGQEYSRW